MFGEKKKLVLTPGKLSGIWIVACFLLVHGISSRCQNEMIRQNSKKKLYALVIRSKSEFSKKQKFSAFFFREIAIRTNY
jgi:hypothetical protein